MKIRLNSFQRVILSLVILLSAPFGWAQEASLSPDAMVSKIGASQIGDSHVEQSPVGKPLESASNPLPVNPMDKVLSAKQVGSQLPDHSAYIGQVMLGLIFILGLIFAIAWLMRRFGQGTLMGGQHMKVVSSLPLGPREKILLVDVGGEQLLLGVTPGRINCLHNFTSPVVPVEDSSDGTDFAQKLKEILGRTTVK